jgi:phosphoribosyl 1,2-cyclic phosphate phosphodiesterase
VDAFRFIFLGTGTSGGIPLIACDCDVCTSDDPRDVRTRQGACVQWVDPRGVARTVLIDTTPDLREQAIRHNLWRCDAIVFTHNHVDHIFGLDEVRRFNAVMKAPIDVYAEHATMESLRRVYKHVFDAASNVNDSFVATLIPRLIQPETPLDLWGLRFLPIRLLHGRLPILGFRIEPAPGAWGRREIALGGEAMPLPLAYCTDVSAIPTETWRHLRGLDTLVIDGLRFRHHPTHFNLDQAQHAAAEIGARQAWFVHLAHEIKHAEVDPGLPEGMNLAYDGLTLGSPHEPTGAAAVGDPDAARFDEG